MKRLLCILFILTIIISCIPTAIAATDEDYHIYFDTTGLPKFTDIYCHIWKLGGTSFFPFLTAKEKCEKVSGNLYSYDVRNLWTSKEISGGLQVNQNYCVMFSTNNFDRTYDLTFDASCIGDTAYLTRQTVSYLSDCYETEWENSYQEYGSHLAINPKGEIVGSKLCSNESKESFIGSWLVTYYNKFEVNEVASIVSKAMQKVKLYDDNKIYEYIYNATGSKSNPLIDLILFQATNDACGVITLSKTQKLLYVGDTYKIPVTKSGNYKKITYVSKNKNIVTVNQSGKITAKKAGKTTIEIKTPYITKKFNITVKKPSIKLKETSLIMTVGEKEKLKYKTAPSKGFKITWKSSKKKNVSVSTSGKIKALKQGKAYITVIMKYKGKSYKSKCKVISLKL